jgi:nitric oxide reductase NorQ protein
MYDSAGEQLEKRAGETTIEQSLLIEPRPMRGFVQTPHVREVTARALNYLYSGFPVHFRGPTGAGKTTLALYIAYKLRRPMLLIHGDDQFTSADLTGKAQGYRKKMVIDEFVRGVSKTEESMQQDWVDHRLTVAVREGYTLLYDEFNRSRPEANNILLSVLQEGVLDFPVSGGKGEVYLKVHPNFRVIFTSNPEEYAGVHKTQDALLDRMITIDLESYDVETEIKITAAKCRVSLQDAEKIVYMVRQLREQSSSGFLPTVRACIMVGTSMRKYRGARVAADSDPFRKICHDVLISEMSRSEDRKSKEVLRDFLNQLIDTHCPSDAQESEKIEMSRQKKRTFDREQEESQEQEYDATEQYAVSMPMPVPVLAEEYDEEEKSLPKKEKKSFLSRLFP